MFGKNTRVSPLELRKQLLIAESEINRVRMLEEWQGITEGIRSVTDRAKSVSSLTSAAALLAAGVCAFWRKKVLPASAKTSWLQTALKGAKLAGSIWLAFRARP